MLIQKLMYVAVLMLFLGATIDANAQKRGHGHHHPVKHHNVHVKSHDKAFRHDHKHVKHHAKHHRDHDHWYYKRRLHLRHPAYVYFPAYRTYYDPYRKGYLYLHHGAWVFAPALPAIMSGANLGAVQVQFSATLPL